MFDVGFSEIVLIAVVALIVIGPERLPKTARTLGLLFGRLQRYVNDVKADISREMELDELRRLQQQVKGAAQELERSVSNAVTEVRSGVQSVEQQLNAAASEASTKPSDVAATDTAQGEAPASAAPGSVTPSTAKPDHPQASLPGFDKI